MEEGLGPYHVPQQTRREKLRFTPSGCADLLPLSIPSDLLTCANPNPESSNLQAHPSSLQIINHTPFFTFPPHRAEPLSLTLSSAHSSNLNLQRFPPSNDAVSGGSVGPLGPFTGHASVLQGSSFLKPAQQLLEELCDVGGRGVHAAKTSSFLEPPPEGLSSGYPTPVGDGDDGRKKKSRLLSILDEVYKRYKQFYQQMQAIVTSFEYVSSLGNIAPYATLAIKAMSKHFKCLKNVITNQLQFPNKACFHKIDDQRVGGGPYGQTRAINNPEFLGHQPIWRPQRGLPERAVTVLKAWLFEHFLHPYPTDTDKLMLAKQTGLSRSQVANWFINARVRLWKPMVEEIHMLETRQPQKHTHTSESEADHTKKNKHPGSPKFHQHHVPFNKRTRTYDYDYGPPHDTMPGTNQVHNTHNVVANGGVTHGVSLTLGLHQNNAGLVVSNHFPMSETHCFDLAVSGFESQSRLRGRDRVGIGGRQLLHEFVG